LKTIYELKTFLEKNKYSPEDLSPRVNISNMTLRRLLKKAPQSKIPVKYQVQLDQLLKPAVPDLNNVASVIDYLHDTGETVVDGKIDQLKLDLDEKLKTTTIDQSFKDKIKSLFQVALSGKNRQAQVLAIGALLYFINPIDLIPDYLPFGYMDDLGVITLAIGSIVKLTSKTAQNDESDLLPH